MSCRQLYQQILATLWFRLHWKKKKAALEVARGMISFASDLHGLHSSQMFGAGPHLLFYSISLSCSPWKRKFSPLLPALRFRGPLKGYVDRLFTLLRDLNPLPLASKWLRLIQNLELVSVQRFLPIFLQLNVGYFSPIGNFWPEWVKRKSILGYISW